MADSILDTLDKMHKALAKEMLKRLEGDEPVTSQEMNVIRQFLKDNGIDKPVSPSTGESPFDSLVKGVDANLKHLSGPKAH